MKTEEGEGFTLVEVLAVTGLLAILLVVVVPQLFVPEQLTVETTARRVAADLGLARRLAIARRLPYVVTFTPPGGPFTAYAVAPQGGPVEPDFPKDLTGVTATGPNQVLFQPSGAAGAAAVYTFSASGTTAQVSVLATTGRVSVAGP